MPRRVVVSEGSPEPAKEASMHPNGQSAELPAWPGEEPLASPPRLPTRTAIDLGIRELTVTWGEETHNPIQFHTVKVGGLTATVVLGADADVKEAARQAYELLGEIAAEQFEQKLTGFFGRAKQAAQRAKGSR